MIRIISIRADMRAPGIALTFKEHLYRNHEILFKIISDFDCLFMSRFWKALFTSMSSKLSASSAIHRLTDGQFEISNGNSEGMIRDFGNFKEEDLEEYLVNIEVVFNSALNISTLCTSLHVNCKSAERVFTLKY